MRSSGPALVIDTNVVLDLLVFADRAAAPLQALLDRPGARWLATPAMRDELRRVLGYPAIAARLRGSGAAGVLAAFDARTQAVADAPPAAARCADPDDQKFIDLALAHRALLLSRDKAVLCMGRRLAALGAWAASPAGPFTPP